MSLIKLMVTNIAGPTSGRPVWVNRAYIVAVWEDHDGGARIALAKHAAVNLPGELKARESPETLLALLDEDDELLEARIAQAIEVGEP